MPVFGSQQKTRLFFTTDIHGSSAVFNKFISAAKFYEVEVLILGGDLTGQSLVPLVEESHGRFSASHLGQEYHVQTAEELLRLELYFENCGLYPLHISPEEVDAFKYNPELSRQRLVELAVARLTRWMELAEERLRGSGVHCYLQPGNADPYEVDAVLQQSGLVQNVDRRIVGIDEDHALLSVGAGNQTPWNAPRDKTEAKLASYIEEQAKTLSFPSQSVFNLHMPPYNTSLDSAPELDEDLHPLPSQAGGVKMTSMGSKAVRQAIEKYQPLLSLHGHIHEACSAQKIGRTLCINPGSGYAEGLLRGVYIELSKKGLEDYIFTQNQAGQLHPLAFGGTQPGD